MPATTVDYTIDGVGRRVAKSVDTTLTRSWIYLDQLRIGAEIDHTQVPAATTRFIYGSRPHVPDYMEKGGDVYRFVTDHLGSVRLVVDVATGNVAQRIDYDAWGNPTLVTGSWDVQPFGFAGGLYDPDTGLYRFGARDYDPEVGRWTTKDPIRFGGGQANLYLYVAGDPVNRIDPSGLLTVPWWTLNVLGAGYVLGHMSYATGAGIYYYYKSLDSSPSGMQSNIPGWTDDYQHCYVSCEVGKAGPIENLTIMGMGHIWEWMSSNDAYDSLCDLSANSVGRGDISPSGGPGDGITDTTDCQLRCAGFLK